MLVIRREQFKSFEQMLFDEFVVCCTAYVRAQYPAVAAGHGEADGLREFTKDCIRRSMALGFRDREHHRKFLDWECRFGAKFYELQPWEWLKAILHNGLDPAIRVYRIEVRLEILRNRGKI